MTSTTRVELHELRERKRAISEISRLSGLSEAEILADIRQVNDRVKSLLGYEMDPVVVSPGGSLKVEGIAGLLRLNSRVEIEVVPKFLDPASSDWRSDFFLLAVLVETGHLLLHDSITADAGERGDIATLIARSLLATYAENERRPIRSYRRLRTSGFAIDGDVEWETTVLPDADGFAMTRLELTRQNPFNATIAAAIRILIPEVTDADTQAQLRLVSRLIGPQPAAPAVPPLLAPRHNSWQRAYELSRLVLDGFGLAFRDGSYTGPGFVISTWAAWEALCGEIVRRALPDFQVHTQKQWVLGYRGAIPVHAKPDLSPVNGEFVPLLFDAKYKTRHTRTPRISSADLYESLAFLRAARTSLMFLLYPASSGPDAQQLGEWREFDQVNVDDLTVLGFTIQIQGLARKDGFESLVRRAKLELSSRMNGSVPMASSGFGGDVEYLGHNYWIVKAPSADSKSRRPNAPGSSIEELLGLDTFGRSAAT